MRTFVHLAALVAVFLMGARSAEAGSTVIYYSAPESVYGWCAGYDSNRSHNCGRNECAKRSGTACKPVAECGGYGAVAYAERPVEGFGAGCAGDVSSARRVALVSCVTASNAICWTEVAFTPNGKTIGNNKQFDTTWYVQVLLDILKFYKGSKYGEPNADTSAGASAFQEKLGQPRTGIINDELMRRLLDAVGGGQNFTFVVNRDILPGMKKAITDAGASDRMFSTAASPAKPLTISEDFNGRSVAERRLALATYLAARGYKCTPPAKAVQLVDSTAVAGIWDIDCSEGSYTLVLRKESTIVMPGSKSK